MQGPHDIIMGMDFIKSNKLSVVNGEFLQFQNNRCVPLVAPPKRSTLARTVTSVSLPPKSRTSVRVSISKKHHPKNQTLLFEPTYLFEQKFPHLQMLPSMMSTSHQAYISIVNSSEEHVNIPELCNIAIGCLTPQVCITELAKPMLTPKR